MAKALKIGAVVVGVAALAIVTGGAAAGLGVSLATGIGATGITAGTLVLASTALSVGAALLQGTPKVPSAQTDRLFANIDPRTFRKTVLGQTAFPIDVRYEEWSGKDQEFCDWIVCFASHAIDGLEEIWFNTELAWTAVGGVQGRFRGYFDLPNLVLEGSPANAFSFASGKWNGSTRLTGCAYARFRFKLTGNGKKAESPFASGIPSRITAIGRGAKLYDPRRDSTVPGGNGPMRADDQSTWRYKADDGAVIGENIPLQILRVVLGWRIRNPVTGEMRLATGSGVPGRRLLLSSFIDGANLADELVNRSAGGQEPRYHGAAVVSEGDDPKTTLDMLCAACCGRFRDTGGRLSFAIAHNDLGAAATDDGLNDDDVISAFTWDPDPALEATPNIVRGRYVDATTASLYQLIDYPEVRITSPDGQDRVLPLDLGAVESPSQAQRIAKQVLQRRQYQREFTSTFDIRAWKYSVGDVVPFTFAPLSFARMLFRVKAQELTQDGSCAMTLTVEHPSLYLWDASDSAPVQAAEPIVYDSRNNPLILAIDDAATTADWDKITDPIGTKPEDNATVGAPDGTNIGGRPVTDVLAAFDAAQAQQNHFETVVIPAVDDAVADAKKRVEDAEKSLVDVAQRVTTVESSSAGGGNLLTNTDWPIGTEGWHFGSENDSRGYRGEFSPDNYWPSGVPPLLIYQPNGSAERAGFWDQTVYGIEGGASYQASLYVASHRCTAGIWIDCFRADGQFNGGTVRATSEKFNSGTRQMSDYERLVLNFDAPADTAFMIFYLMKYGTSPGEGDSYSWFLRPQLAKIRKGVTAALPYEPGSSNAGQATLNAKVTAIEKAGDDGRIALARRTLTLEANSRALPQYLNKQAAFSDWPDGSGDIPGGWGLASASAGAQAGRVEGLIGRYALETYWPGGAGNLFYAVSALNFADLGGGVDPGMYVGPGWFVVDVDVTLAEGTLFGAGCYIAGYSSDGVALATRQWHFIDNEDATGAAPGGGAPGKRYRFSFMTEMSDPRITSLRFHPMTAWAGFQAEPAAKRLRWNLAGVRQASALEIASRKAIDVTIPAVSARVKVQEDALASLPDLYATALRAEALEAQVNFAADSGLKRTLSAQIEDRATAIADAKAGVVATSVQTLRTDFDGRIGVVEQKAGAITDIDGRTSVYWQVTGTTNDGATMIQLTKKDGSSPLFYIGANTLIDGNLMVTGTVNTRVIQNGAVTNSVTTTGGTYGFQQNTVQETGTVTMSIAGTGYVRIDVRLSTNYVDGESGSTAPNQWFLALYCEQNGSQRLVGSTPFREGPYVSFWDVDVPSAGTARYFVRITLSVAQRNGTVFNTKINATEYKK